MASCPNRSGHDICNGRLQVKLLAMIDVLGSLDQQLREERATALSAANIAAAAEDFTEKDEQRLLAGMLTMKTRKTGGSQRRSPTSVLCYLGYALAGRLLRHPERCPANRRTSATAR